MTYFCLPFGLKTEATAHPFLLDACCLTTTAKPRISASPSSVCIDSPDLPAMNRDLVAWLSSISAQMRYRLIPEASTASRIWSLNRLAFMPIHDRLCLILNQAVSLGISGRRCRGRVANSRPPPPRRKLGPHHLPDHPLQQQRLVGDQGFPQLGRQGPSRCVHHEAVRQADPPGVQ